MFNISKNNIISMNRGDSGSFSIQINIGTELEPIIYSLKPKDKVYFGVMEPNQKFDCSYIMKTYTIDDIQEDNFIDIKLIPSDTEYMLTGTYFYEIKLYVYNSPLIDPETNTEIKDMSDVYTIQPKRKFVIME